MKKLLLSVLLSFLLIGSSFAATQPTIYGDMVSAWTATAVTDALATHNRSRAVWIGTTQSYDFSFDGSTWVLFQGATAGTVLPIQIVGARITSGSASPASGDINFLN